MLVKNKQTTNNNKNNKKKQKKKKNNNNKKKNTNTESNYLSATIESRHFGAFEKLLSHRYSLLRMVEQVVAREIALANQALMRLVVTKRLPETLAQPIRQPHLRANEEQVVQKKVRGPRPLAGLVHRLLQQRADLVLPAA